MSSNGRDAKSNAADHERLVVVGGGVIGCAIARELADEFEVVLLEKGQIAGEATALAAGEFTIFSGYPDHSSIGHHAASFFRDYDGTGAFEFTELPSVELVTPDRLVTARRRAARQAENELPVQYLESDVARERYPRFDLSSFAGVVEYRTTGFLDPYTLTVTLQADAEKRGVDVRTGVRAEVISVEAGRVTGVRTDDGAIEADHVVVAAGWRTRSLLFDHIELPVRPYRTQCVVLRPSASLSADFPMGWYPGEHLYFRPELNGDLLVGGWSFAEDDPERASDRADEEFLLHIADLLPTFLEEFDRTEVVNDWAGVDGATPDTRPIVDAPADAPEGLVVATGFHGRGVMTAPVAATAVRSLLTGEEAPFPVSPFALDRFDSRSPDFEFTSISAGD